MVSVTVPVCPLTLCTGAPAAVMKLLSLFNWLTFVGTGTVTAPVCPFTEETGAEVR